MIGGKAEFLSVDTSKHAPIKCKPISKTTLHESRTLRQGFTLQWLAVT